MRWVGPLESVGVVAVAVLMGATVAGSLGEIQAKGPFCPNWIGADRDVP